MNHQIERALRDAWWPATAAVARLTGEVSVAEDGVQEACAQALMQWPRDGVPENATGWVVTVARRRAVDQLRREATRPAKELLAMQVWAAAECPGAVADDDQLALLFACCHPALEANARVTLTLRVVCGLSTASIARLLILPEPTVAQRVVRAKRKIRDAGIRLRVPATKKLPSRLDAVLKAIYLTLTEGHAPTGTDSVVRHDLCDEAVRLARALHKLMPDQPEVTGMLALALLTDARTTARVDDDGNLVLLSDQDRSRWDKNLIAEGNALVVQALSRRQPGPYQLQAAIAACHADAATAEDTDWRQIATLYGELLLLQPSPVIEANRAVAIAYAEGAAAGLVILDTLSAESQLVEWPQLQIARARLLARAGRIEDAIAAYLAVLALEPSAPTREFLSRQIASLRAAQVATERP